MQPSLSIPSTLSAITTPWSPVLIASLNSSATEVKIAKIHGSFIFHSHPDSDELFYVLRGAMTIEIESAGASGAEQKAQVQEVKLKEGDVFVVPMGVRHRPVSEEGAEIMLVEKGGVVNTGDAGVSDLTKEVPDWRMR